MSFAVKDDSIIKKAYHLIEGQGDGRISKEDMRELLKIDLDTPEKMETMLHILTTYNVTSTAKTQNPKFIIQNTKILHKQFLVNEIYTMIIAII